MQIGCAPQSSPVYSASKQINSSCVFSIETLSFRDFLSSKSDKSREQINCRPRRSKRKPLWHRLNNDSFSLLYFLSKRCPCFTFRSVSEWCVLVVVCFEVSLVCDTDLKCLAVFHNHGLIWFDFCFIWGMIFASPILSVFIFRLFSLCIRSCSIHHFSIVAHVQLDPM